MNRKIEILAPAGSYDSMRAAMNAGCDAVYIGGSSFGARAYAQNLDEDMLLKAIDEAHIRGKRVYLTVNTLLKERELADQLYKYLKKYYQRGLDAVIVQDVGVLHFIHRHFPDLPIHASTQMALTMACGAELLKEHGVTRLVTSRELSLHEIKNIRENTDLEIETFVHGALCYCYSGQCLMSSMIGGRSGNRGRCAQPCRMPYRLFSDGKCLSGEQPVYLLSPKDINTLAIIPELLEAGIDSFKIEGRMKSPEYAAVTSYMYRKYVDLYFKLGAQGYRSYINDNEFKEDMLKLQDVYNRGGFSQGYAKAYHGKEMMSLYRPNHSGVLVGRVKAAADGYADISLRERLNAQDVLEIRHGQDKVYEFTLKDYHEAGELIRIKLPRVAKSSNISSKNHTDREGMVLSERVKVGAEVYRTRNNSLLDYLAEEYIKRDQQYPVKGILKAKRGERLTLTLSYSDKALENKGKTELNNRSNEAYERSKDADDSMKNLSITAYKDPVEQALKQPVTEDRIRAQLEKTGDSFFYFDKLLIEADDNIFIPIAKLNELRREAINLLEEAIKASYRRPDRQNDNKDADSRNDSKDADRQNDYKEEDERLPSTDDKDKAESISMDPFKAESISKGLYGDFGMAVSVQTMKQWRMALNLPEITALYVYYESFSNNDLLSMARQTMKAGKDFYLTLPHICRLAVYNRLKKDLSELTACDEIKGYVVKNFEEIALLKSLFNIGAATKQIILNYNMYVYNNEARSFWIEQGIRHFTAAVELNHKELRELCTTDSDILVYGHLPLMISAQCVFDNSAGCMKGKMAGTDPEEGVSGVLVDRLDKEFFVKAYCKSCYNIIYNGQPLALHKQAEEIIALKPKNIRLDFSLETDEQMKKVLNIFINSYCYGKDVDETIDSYTTGHFKRGIL